MIELILVGVVVAGVVALVLKSKKKPEPVQHKPEPVQQKPEPVQTMKQTETKPVVSDKPKTKPKKKKTTKKKSVKKTSSKPKQQK